MALTLPSPRLIDPSSVPALNWGVIGTGVAASFVKALHSNTPQRAVAVTARDEARTTQFAVDHGIATVHRSVDELVSDPGLEAVYIATPHPLHAEQALAAIAVGKHVLIEKPMAMSAAEAERITSAARERGVLAMEAMWTRYLPQSDIVRQLLADGVLGDVHLVTADFGFVGPADPTHRLWNPALGGGALLDAGVYPISFASSVLGPIDHVQAAGELNADGVDARASLQLTSRSGGIAQVSTSLVTTLRVEAAVHGSKGVVRVLMPFFSASGIELTLGQYGMLGSATWRDERAMTPSDAMSDQATAFARYVSEGLVESPVHPHDEVVDVLRVIDEARAQLAAQQSR